MSYKTLNLGRVKPIWQGEYDSAANYQPLDFLRYNQAVYICIKSSQGNAPTNPSFFMPLVDTDVLNRQVQRWDAMTGPLDKPAIVYHNGDYWSLSMDVADVSTAVPGASEAWERIPNDTTVIVRPSIINPADGSTGFYGQIEASAYQTSSRFVGPHTKTVWQASTVEDFSLIYADRETTTDLTTWTLPLPDPLQTVWIRVRYESNGFSSDWSPIVRVVIADYKADPPTFITPTNNAVDQLIGLSFQITPYSPNLTDEHAATSWELRNDNNDVVWQALEDADNLTERTVPQGILSGGRSYKMRARHIGAFFGEQAWSDFVNITIASPDTPTVTSPASSEITNTTPAFESSTLAVLGDTTEDTHVATSYRVTSGGTTVWESLENQAISGATPPPDTLQPGQTYAISVRHHGDIYGESGWSSPVSFTIVEVDKPVIASPAANETNVGETPLLEASVFNANGGTHAASQWRIYQASTPVYESGDVSDLEAHAVPYGNLDESTVYNCQVRYKSSLGEYSAWSDLSTFTTEAKFPRVYAIADKGGTTDGRADKYSGSDLTRISLLDVNGQPFDCEYGSDGSLYAVYSGSITAAIKVNPATMSVVDTFSPIYDINTLAFGTDGNLYVGGSTDRVIKVDTASMTSLSEYRNETSDTYSLCFGGDGYLYAGRTGFVSRINPVTMALTDTFNPTSGNNVTALAYGADGNVYCAFFDDIKQVDPATMTETGSAQVHTGRVRALAFGPDGYLYSASADDTVRKIDPATMTQSLSFNINTSDVYDIAYGDDGYLYAACGYFTGMGEVIKIDPVDMTEVERSDSLSGEKTAIACNVSVINLLGFTTTL